MWFDSDGGECSPLDIILELIFGIHTIACEED
jgi:hypothetical protein